MLRANDEEHFRRGFSFLEEHGDSCMATLTRFLHLRRMACKSLSNGGEIQVLSDSHL